MHKNFSHFLILAAIVIITSTLFSSFYFIAYAQVDTSLLKDSIDKNNIQISALNKEIQDYLTRIANTKGAAKTLKEALALLEGKKLNLQNEISVAKYKITNTQDSIENTTGKIVTVQNKIDILKNGIVSSLKNKNVASPLDNPILTLFTSSKLSVFFETIRTDTNFRDELKNSTDHLKVAKSDLSQDKSDYEKQYKDLLVLKDELDSKKSLVDSNKKETDRLLKDTQNKETLYKQQLALKEKKKKELQAEVLDFESKIKATVNLSTLPKSGSGVLQYPVKNVKVTQYFGNTPFSTQNPQVYNGSGHNGIDFAASVGTSIYSAGDGVVSGSGNSDDACTGVSYGRWILVKHNNGLSTLYAHLSNNLVSDGQRVTAGQKIALSGNTGYSTGPHLHFTVYASDAVHIAGPTEYKSKVCGTYMRIPLAPRNAYLNPLTYL